MTNHTNVLKIKKWQWITLIISGAHFAHSFTQLERVDKGTTIKNGPRLFLNSMMYASRAIVCIVFPRPISSAWYIKIDYLIVFNIRIRIKEIIVT